MKWSLGIICIISFVAMICSGCKQRVDESLHASDQKRATEGERSNEVDQALSLPEANDANGDGSALVEPRIADAWIDAMEDDEQGAKARYDEAFALVRLKSNEKARLFIKNASRLGDWVVVQVGVDDSSHSGGASIALFRHAYVVDLANRRIISRDGWREVIVFYQGVYERILKNRELATMAFVDNMARFSAAVAAENNEILIPEEENAHPAGISRPALRISGDEMTLTWYSTNSAVPPMYIRYRVTYRNGGINFMSEIVETESSGIESELYELD